MALKNRIKIMREARGWSLEMLASQSGTTNQQISLLEAGKRRLTVEWLLRLSGALECHPWELVDHVLPKPPESHEVVLLERFRGLSADQQRVLLELLGTMSKPLTSRLKRSKKKMSRA
jgi:transcriptional regulator with XRE-family HTH domain